MKIRELTTFSVPDFVRGWVFDLNNTLIVADVRFRSFVSVIPGAFPAMQSALRRFPETIGILTAEPWPVAESALFFLNADIPKSRVLCGISKRDPSVFDSIGGRLHLPASEFGIADDSLLSVVNALANGCRSVVLIKRHPDYAAQLFREMAEWSAIYGPEIFADAEDRLVAVDGVSSIRF